MKRKLAVSGHRPAVVRYEMMMSRPQPSANAFRTRESCDAFQVWSSVFFAFSAPIRSIDPLTVLNRGS